MSQSEVRITTSEPWEIVDGRETVIRDAIVGHVIAPRDVKRILQEAAIWMDLGVGSDEIVVAIHQIFTNRT